MKLHTLLLWIFLPLMLSCSKGEERLPQRVVLITLDTLRYDSFAREGPGMETLMPATRALAREGLSFDNFYANTSTTQPSHASLFSGLNPWAHGVTRNGMLLDQGLPNLADQLRRRGFATSAVVSSFPLQRQFGFANGFDSFEDRFEEPYVQVWEGRTVEQGRFFSLADSVTAKALLALDAAPKQDQFFWFHYFDPHDPYGDSGEEVMGVGWLLNQAREQAVEPVMTQQLERARRLYGMDVRAMDLALGRLYERLERDAQQFETHIVLTADHGESFGELGAIGHGKRLTREQVQVPLVIVSPRVEPGQRGDAASLVDLASTILPLVGVHDGPFAGRDLLLAGADPMLPVLGMRRSFAQPKSEICSDGRQWPLPADWFFRVQGRQLVCGNEAEALLEGDRSRPLKGPLGSECRALFAALGALAKNGPDAVELLDDDVKHALGALGYLDSEDN